MPASTDTPSLEGEAQNCGYAKKGSVAVHTINAPKEAATQYFNLEAGPDHVLNVLVEIEKARDLQRAFPNYFGNVKMFHSQLRSIMKPNEKLEMKAIIADPVRPERHYDLSWLKTYKKKK